MAMPIEQAAVLRIKEILEAAGETAVARPPVDTDPASVISVSFAEPVGAEDRTAVWLTFQHSTDGENVNVGVAEISYATMEVYIGSPDSLKMVEVARAIRLGLFTVNANYWPTTGLRRQVRNCRAASGGLQLRMDDSPRLYVERMMATVCFDDTDGGVAGA